MKKESTGGYSINNLGFQFDLQDQPISAIDIDQDQDIDIVYGKYLLLNDSVFVRMDLFPYENVISMDWGDFDGDHDLDAALLAQDSIGNYITRIFRNYGNLNFTPLEVKIQAFNKNGFIRWLDYNNDGLLDLATSGAAGVPGLFIYVNQGNAFLRKRFFRVTWLLTLVIMIMTVILISFLVTWSMSQTETGITLSLSLRQILLI